MSGDTAVPQRAFDPFESVHGNAVHAALEAIVTVDEQQRIVMFNPAAQRMFGCTADEALGSALTRFIPLPQREAHARHVREFAASGALELPMGERGAIFGLRANGETFPAVASISRMAIKGESGTRHFFTALLCDLSQEQGLRAEIETLNRRMRAVFEQAPVAIWITMDEHIVFANRACVSLFGAAARADLTGRSIYSLLMPESHAEVRSTVAQALASDLPMPRIMERIARLDGKVREVVIAVAGLPDHGRTAVQMVISDITEQTEARHALERSRRELRSLSANLVNAREEERRRIARELHDELGQRLTALKMELSSLASLTRAQAGKARIGSMLDMVDETVASVRRNSTELRPLMLDDLGLNAAIEWLANSWAARMGIAVSLRLGARDPDIGEAASITVYRMVQEALTNIARHANASAVRIEMQPEAGELLLTVQDNGVGFAEPSMYQEGSHGLMGIRERAYMLGGHLEIGNSRGGGGRITVRLPLRPSDAGTDA
jgi:two-component system sensor histidine kinase UhpB